MNYFCTRYLNQDLYQNLANSALKSINNRCYDDAEKVINSARSLIKENKLLTNNEDELNEYFVIDIFFNLISSVASYWQEIESESYHQSWWRLQDALDALRDVKSLGYGDCILVSFFESQLKSLESIYPYKLFSSMGFIVEKYECSICGFDIDGDDCIHLKGRLYAGEMAIGIANNIKNIDHIAIVEKPKNKRLVIGDDDSHPVFQIFKLLVKDFEEYLTPLNFSCAQITEFERTDNNWVNQGRNSICSCGSGLKFKKCCESKNKIKHMHVDFVGGSFFN